MEIRNITWEETIALRHEVLWPNKEIEYCHLEGDETAWHYGAFVRGKLVSVASIFPKGQSARLRKFATLVSYQGEGIGTAMIKHIIYELKQKNITKFWCDARETAIGFYQRFGMEIEGEKFYKSQVPYFKMSVALE